MSESIDGFIGRWEVKWATGNDPAFLPGSHFQIGTGRNGATAPFLDTTTNEIAVGFAIQEAGSTTNTLSSEDTPVPLLFRGGVLFFDGQIAKDPNPERLRVYVALAEPEGTTRRYLYGTTLRGDPEQVAVWGATDHTPP